MAYKGISLTLTDEQMVEIEAAVNDDVPFALLAQPQIRGIFSGQLNVYVCTAKQHQILETAIKEAREYPAYD